MELVTNSRLYVLKLLEDRGPLSLAQLSHAAPRNGRDASIDIGRGATIEDFVNVMFDEGVVTGSDQSIELSPLGAELVAKATREDIDRAVKATPQL